MIAIIVWQGFIGPWLATERAGYQLAPSAWGGRFPLQVPVRPYDRDGRLFRLPQDAVADCLSFRSGGGRGAHFEMTLDAGQAASFAERLLQRGRPC